MPIKIILTYGLTNVNANNAWDEIVAKIAATTQRELKAVKSTKYPNIGLKF